MHIRELPFQINDYFASIQKVRYLAFSVIAARPLKKLIVEIGTTFLGVSGNFFNGHSQPTIDSSKSRDHDRERTLKSVQGRICPRPRLSSRFL
jgi:hypothetical protein